MPHPPPSAAPPRWSRHWPSHWPRAADPRGAALLGDALLGPGAPLHGLRRTRRVGVAQAALGAVACLGGNSRYLSDLAQRSPELLRRTLLDGPDRVVADALAQVAGLPADTSRPAMAHALRLAKQQVALATALADLGGLWSLEAVTGALSRLAETCLDAAIAHLLASLHRTGQLTLPDPAHPLHECGFVALGMGKLGARELNYSSDIDLILLYDPDQHDNADALRTVFTRVANDLVTLMAARDADGYVFRVDLRLRPTPSATPPALSLPSAIGYYESLGQDWERAAMTKARPVAGDLGCGQRFLDAIRPFVWRRHLDFAAIDEMRAMKQRIDAQGGGAAKGADLVSALLDRDLKRGPGGIREIEFVAQTLQLVWGGRAPGLREPTTEGALAALAAAGHLDATRAGRLAAHYRLLRTAEHRLQMQDDRQTHSLPATPEALDAFACFMDLPDRQALAALLGPALDEVRREFTALLAAPDAAMAQGPPPPSSGDDAATATTRDPPIQELSIQGLPMPDPDTPGAPDWLRRLGYTEPERATALLRDWRTPRLRALRTPRARALLAALLPALLDAFARQPDPDRVLLRFDTLLAGLPAGVQLLSLLRHNPALLLRIARVLSAAPWLAEHLAQVPAALEGLLAEDAFTGSGQRALLAMLRQRMREASGIAEAVEAAQRLVRGEEFRLAVAQLEGRLGIDRAGLLRTALADRVIAELLVLTTTAHVRRYGSLRGGGLAVVALGKAGSREMTAGSDLDLLLVYDAPADTGESSHGVPVSQYYSRLCHALIAALSMPGREGKLYDLDMRLRPSGSQGPVAVSLASFTRYHRESAWTWERLALTRARVVAGPASLRHRLAGAIDAALQDAGDPDRLRRDVADMRRRLAEARRPQGVWDVKLRPGGLMEVEFAAQLLQLQAPGPASRAPTTRIALARLGRHGLLPVADARTLIEADRLWRALQNLLRLLVGPTPPPTLSSLPPATGAALLSGLSREFVSAPGNLAALTTRLDGMAARVSAIFVRLTTPLDASATPSETSGNSPRGDDA